MKITIIAIGHKQSIWIKTGVHYYLDRLPQSWYTNLIEIKPIQINSVDTTLIISAEGKRILEIIPDKAYVCALSEHGENWSTTYFAKKFKSWQNQHKSLIFVIGGSHGLDQTVINRSSVSLRLSSMTLPHALARLLLVEQLYRLSTIQNNHPYHRV